MSNIRFLDNVAVSSYQSSQNVGSNFPRVVFAGEIKMFLLILTHTLMMFII
jgi:hypothetical protein